MNAFKILSVVRSYVNLSRVLLVGLALVATQLSAHEHESHAPTQDDDKTMAAMVKDAASDDDKIALFFDNKTIVVEYADEHEERALGLMYRRSMCADCGMLFKFDSKRIASIWMKNTYIPLDLAYIDTDGTIVDIHQLEPFNLEPVASSQAVLYALEMNLAWFAKHDINIGQKIKIQGQ